MKIFECKPNNLPEDILDDFESYPLIIGNTIEQVEQEQRYPFKTHVFTYRRKNGKGYCSWCGEHPRYWREMSDIEKKDYVKWLNKLYM